MTPIRTASDHQELLAQGKALLVLEFSWSQPALTSTDRIRQWHDKWSGRSSDSGVPLYVLDGDSVADLWPWMGNSLVDHGGFGSLHLLKSGQVVHSFPKLPDVTLEEISLRCDEVFGRAT